MEGQIDVLSAEVVFLCKGPIKVCIYGITFFCFNIFIKFKEGFDKPWFAHTRATLNRQVQKKNQRMYV